MNCHGLIAFDLDGTLIDSLEGIHSSLEHACGKVQLQAPSLAALRGHIGPPLRDYLPELLDLKHAQDQRILQAVLEAFRSHHDSEGWRRFHLYDGVITLLERLHAAGYGLHVVTQKPRPIAQAVLHQAKLAGYMDSLHAPEIGVCFNKYSSLNQLRQRQVACHWYVGDTAGDQQAATQARYCFAAATYGYGRTASAEVQLTCPLDLLQVLERSA